MAEPDHSAQRHRRRTALAGRLVLVLELLVALLGVAVWRLVPPAAALPSGPPPTPGPNVTRPATLESAYPMVLGAARTWDPRAALLSVSEQVDWPTSVPDGPIRDLPAGGWLTYVFVGDGGHGPAVFAVQVTRPGASIVQESAQPWSMGTPATGLDPLGLKAASVVALVAAESAGGTEFRRSCPASRRQSRIMLDTAGVAAAGRPVWLVTYHDDRHPDRDPFAVRVDATTGQVVAVEPPTPPGEACGG